MRRLQRQVVKVILISSVVGCGFSPGQPGESLTGNGGSSGNTTGAGGLTGTGGNLNIGLSSGAGGDLGSGGTSMTCGGGMVPVMPLPPDVLIIQDKSGSMANDDSDTACGNGGCGTSSKWSQLTMALTTVVQSTDMNVNWGLKYFSDNGACGATNAPAVPVGAMQAAAITTSITGTGPGGNTPTRDAISSGAAYLATLTDQNPKFLLLATDGLPNCPTGCASMAKPSMSCTNTDNPSEDTAAEAAIMMAAMQGYQTFVIGIGNVASAQNTLNQFAINGGQAQTGAATSYFAATDEATLEAALLKVVGSVLNCQIKLTGVPAGQTNVAVSVDTSAGTPTKVPPDGTNGWTYTDPPNNTTIQLNGMYCDGIKNGTYTNVQFVYACDGQPICIDKLANGTCGDSN